MCSGVLMIHKLGTLDGVMGCSAAEATYLGFVSFDVINPRVFSVIRVDFGLFFYFPILLNSLVWRV